MGKRGFRDSRKSNADYPTFKTFDAGRRQFLAGLGGLIGASARAACGGRAAPSSADSGTPPNPPPPPPDPPNLGGAMPPPAKADAGPDWTVDGDPMQPDARVDQMVLGGEAPQPDAKIDHNIAGGAPMPPAKLDSGCDDDGGSCPNP